MGDMADMAIEQMETFEDLRLDYRTGQMSDAEAYEHGIIDELGYEIGTGESARNRTCRCCKTKGLHWEMHRGKWRLFTTNGLHICPVIPLPKHDC